MEQSFFSSTLICPYPFIEEEALAWSILLFDRVLLLHPFPLPLSETYRSLAEQGLLQIRTAVRTVEEIRQKDRILREIKAYIAGRPDHGLMEYLKQTRLTAQEETREEIIDFLKGEPLQNPPKDPSALTGSILLCLIHDWMIQEQAIAFSWAKVAEQEKYLIQGWRESPEEESIWQGPSPGDLKRIETEIPCPLALSDWKALKAHLFPEPLPLLTTQSWVWTDCYGFDPQDGRTNSIPLPDLSFSDLTGFVKESREWAAQSSVKRLRETFREHLRAVMTSGGDETTAEFQKSLAALGRPSGGQYCLVLPSLAFLSGRPEIFSGKNETDWVMLLAPKSP
jgi:hypothetical protein